MRPGVRFYRKASGRTECSILHQRCWRGGNGSSLYQVASSASGIDTGPKSNPPEQISLAFEGRLLLSFLGGLRRRFFFFRIGRASHAVFKAFDAFSQSFAKLRQLFPAE